MKSLFKKVPVLSLPNLWLAVLFLIVLFCSPPISESAPPPDKGNQGDIEPYELDYYTETCDKSPYCDVELGYYNRAAKRANNIFYSRRSYNFAYYANRDEALPKLKADWNRVYREVLKLRREYFACLSKCDKKFLERIKSGAKEGSSTDKRPPAASRMELPPVLERLHTICKDGSCKDTRDAQNKAADEANDLREKIRELLGQSIVLPEIFLKLKNEWVQLENVYWKVWGEHIACLERCHKGGSLVVIRRAAPRNAGELKKPRRLDTLNKTCPYPPPTCKYELTQYNRAAKKANEVYEEWHVLDYSKDHELKKESKYEWNPLYRVAKEWLEKYNDCMLKCRKKKFGVAPSSGDKNISIPGATPKPTNPSSGSHRQGDDSSKGDPEGLEKTEEGGGAGKDKGSGKKADSGLEGLPGLDEDLESLGDPDEEDEDTKDPADELDPPSDDNENSNTDSIPKIEPKDSETPINPDAGSLRLPYEIPEDDQEDAASVIPGEPGAKVSLKMNYMEADDDPDPSSGDKENPTTGSIPKVEPKDRQAPVNSDAGSLRLPYEIPEDDQEEWDEDDWDALEVGGNAGSGKGSGKKSGGGFIDELEKDLESLPDLDEEEDDKSAALPDTRPMNVVTSGTNWTTNAGSGRSTVSSMPQYPTEPQFSGAPGSGNPCASKVAPLMSGQKIYSTIPSPRSGSPSTGQRPRASSPPPSLISTASAVTTPISVPMPRIKNGTLTSKVVGSDVINGVRTEKRWVRFISTDGKWYSGYIWYASKNAVVKHDLKAESVPTQAAEPAPTPATQSSGGSSIFSQPPPTNVIIQPQEEQQVPPSGPVVVEVPTSGGTSTVPQGGIGSMDGPDPIITPQEEGTGSAGSRPYIGY